MIKRYEQLKSQIVKMKSCTKIMEIGVHKGKSSLRMINAALKKNNNVNFYGFDIFEGMTPELHKNEMAKMPRSEKEIYNLLSETTGAKINLIKGNTSKTLPDFVETHLGFIFDFIFVDGGHSEETVLSDWENVQKLINDDTVIIFDDYVVADKRGISWGCNPVVDNLDRAVWDINFLGVVDKFEWGALQFVKVQRRNGNER